MTVRYEVNTLNSNGTGTSRPTFAAFRSTERVNEAGAYEQNFLTDDDIVLTNGVLLALGRVDDELNATRHVAFKGFHRREEETRTRRVTQIDAGISAEIRDYTSHGTALLGLLAKPYVSFPPGDSKAVKNGDCATVAWELVRDNMGSGATTGNGRYAANNIGATFDIGSSPAAIGVTYQNDVSEMNLLTALRDVAAVSLKGGEPLLFTVDQVNDSYEFEFAVNSPPDKTRGNVGAIVLSVALGTADEITRAVDYATAPNRVIAVGDTPSFAVAESAVSVPLNRQELIVQADSGASAAQIQATADAFSAELAAREQFAIKLNQTNLQLFTNLELGDIVTLVFDGVDYTVWVTQLAISIRPDSEQTTIVVTVI